MTKYLSTFYHVQETFPSAQAGGAIKLNAGGESLRLQIHEKKWTWPDDEQTALEWAEKNLKDGMTGKWVPHGGTCPQDEDPSGYPHKFTIFDKDNNPIKDPSRDSDINKSTKKSAVLERVLSEFTSKVRVGVRSCRYYFTGFFFFIIIIIVIIFSFISLIYILSSSQLSQNERLSHSFLRYRYCPPPRKELHK